MTSLSSSPFPSLLSIDAAVVTGAVSGHRTLNLNVGIVGHVDSGKTSLGPPPIPHSSTILHLSPSIPFLNPLTPSFTSTDPLVPPPLSSP